MILKAWVSPLSFLRPFQVSEEDKPFIDKEIQRFGHAVIPKEKFAIILAQ